MDEITFRHPRWRRWSDVRAEAVRRGLLDEAMIERNREFLEERLSLESASEEQYAELTRISNAEMSVLGVQIPEALWQCGEGWRELLEDLHQKLLAVYPHYTVGQVKEKFGLLRVYLDHFQEMDETMNRLYEVVRQAEAASERICETCGRKGRLFRTPSTWLLVRCPEHAVVDSDPVGDFD